MIKNNIKKLLELQENNDVKIRSIGNDRIENWEQETAVDQLHFLRESQNFLIDVNEETYFVRKSDVLISNRYTAKEEEWIDETTTTDKKTVYEIMPNYLLNEFEQTRKQFSEIYTVDHLNNESDIPSAIKTFFDEIEVASEHAERPKAEYDEYGYFDENAEWDFMDYSDEEDSNSISLENIKPMTIKSKMIFDMKLRKQNLPEEFKGHYKESVYSNDHKYFEKDSLDKLENGVSIEKLRELNDIANQSGQPTAFLHKLDKYAETEVVEMVAMMKSNPTIIEIFSKGLDKYENQTPNVNNKQSRSRKNRL